MNRTRILRLGTSERELRVRTFLSSHKKGRLVHLAASYGLTSVRGMTKPELVDALVEGILKWASVEELKGELDIGGWNGNSTIFG